MENPAPQNEGPKRRQSEGQHRVGKSFNPSNNPIVDMIVDMIKEKAAEQIDMLREVVPDANHPGYEAATYAMLKFEEAAMWAVKAVTKQPR